MTVWEYLSFKLFNVVLKSFTCSRKGLSTDALSQTFSSKWIIESKPILTVDGLCMTPSLCMKHNSSTSGHGKLSSISLLLYCCNTVSILKFEQIVHLNRGKKWRFYVLMKKIELYVKRSILILGSTFEVYFL